MPQQNLPAGLLTQVHFDTAPSQSFLQWVCRRTNPPYSVGYVTELHRLPDYSLSGQSLPGTPEDVIRYTQLISSEGLNDNRFCGI